MTATLVGRLVEQGLLKWDTTVADVLPDLASAFDPQMKDVTVLHLLSHRAGLPANLTSIGHMSATPGHSKVDSMASVSNLQSLDEPSWREVVDCFAKKRLPGGLPSSQRVELDSLGTEIDFTAYQTMDPERIDVEESAQEAHGSSIARSTQVDDPPKGRSLEVKPPPLGKWPPIWSGFDAKGCTMARSRHIALGPLSQVPERAIMEACPDLGLPSAVVGFDSRLEPRFSRGNEDGHNPQGKTRAHDAPDDVTMMMGSLETGIVVELGVCRQSDLAPVFHQARSRRLGGDGRIGPRDRQSPVQGDPVEDFDRGLTFDVHAFDDVEAVEFDLAACDIGQIPAARRRRSPHTLTSVEGPSSFQDATDRADRRHLPQAQLDQFLMDGLGAELSKITSLLERAPKPQHTILDLPGRSIDRDPAATRAIAPVDVLQRSPFGPLNPQLDHGQTNPELTSDRTHGSPFSHQSDHFPSLLFLLFFPSWAPPWQVFSHDYNRYN